MTPDAQQHRVRAALSYVAVLFLLPMSRRESEFCQFHAKQGMLLFLTWVLVALVAWVPLIGQIAWLAMLIVNIVAITKTLNGQKWEIPFLGKYAKRLNW